MNYIYKIEVDCFKFETKYQWNLLCRKGDDATAPWQICAIGEADSPEKSFFKAYAEQQRFEQRAGKCVIV